MSDETLLFHHTHTPDSNRFETAVRGLDIGSHVTDYLEIIERLPRGRDAVFVKTDHWKTDPSYFDRLESRIAERGGKSTRYDAHVAFELVGSRGVVINGVECGLEARHHHVTICGLPLDDERTYDTLAVDELGEVAQRAGWVAPAHIGMPRHRISRSLLEAVCAVGDRSGFEVAFGYTVGYFPTFNRIVRNEVPFRDSVRELASELGVPLLPEIDLHAAVPDGYSGCGVIDGGTMDALCDGRFPVSALLDADLFRPEGRRPGITVGQFVRNYAAFVPLVSAERDYRTLFRQTLPRSDWLEDVDFRASTVPL